MSDAAVGPSEEQVKEAQSLGWTPKENWKGDPEKFIDADAYLERGLGIHHVRSQVEQERNARRALEGRLSENEGALKAANAALEALQASHEEDVKEQVEQARKQLKSELAAASRDGDHELVAELTDKMTQLNSAEDEPAPKDKAVHADQLAESTKRELLSWAEANPEFVKNQRKVALGNVVAAEMRAAGDTRLGKSFLDDVAAKVEKEMGGPARSGHSKVEGGGGGTGGGGSSGANGKSYADLPAEAKAACDKQAARLVGPNRAHKDINSWRKSYASQYFKE